MNRWRCAQLSAWLLALAASAAAKPRSPAAPSTSSAAAHSASAQTPKRPKPRTAKKRHARSAHRTHRHRSHRWHMPRGYAHLVWRWHRRPPGSSVPLDGRGRPELVLESVNTRERVQLAAASDRGGFSAGELDRATHLLRDPRHNAQFPVDPRLINVVYRLERHFHAPLIRVISGYRRPTRYSHSRHGQGRAIDLVVPGVSDHAVAAYVRRQGFCGVGVYPRGGFVHVDVRSSSYFWVDPSGPGQADRARPVLHWLARRADAHALASGSSRPRASVRPNPNVPAAWGAASAGAESRTAESDSASNDADDLRGDRAAADAAARTSASQ